MISGITDTAGNLINPDRPPLLQQPPAHDLVTTLHMHLVEHCAWPAGHARNLVADVITALRNGVGGHTLSTVDEQRVAARDAGQLELLAAWCGNNIPARFAEHEGDPVATAIQGLEFGQSLIAAARHRPTIHTNINMNPNVGNPHAGPRGALS